MPSRVGNRPMPQVTLVDMRKEMENGNRSVFSGQLVAALKNCVARGEQAMLLMNRRGYWFVRYNDGHIGRSVYYTEYQDY